MSLYPSLEDMKVDHMAQAQAHHQQQAAYQPQQIAAAPSYSPSHSAAPPAAGAMSGLYPSLGEYMGIEISHAVVQQHMPETGQDVIRYQPPGSHGIVAPITGEQNMGMARAEVKQGIRMIIACKDGSGKLGIRVQSVNKGVFVSLVTKNSPAALAGLRFGDQILQLNGTTVAGFSMDKVKKLIKNAPQNNIDIAVRDRPFERTITLQKDSAGHAGFIFKDGQITSIVKDSSAARNGLLIEHNILEIGGQNVVGLKDKEISKILTDVDQSITLTIMPTFIYKHMIDSMKQSLMKKEMDHSIPDL